MRWHLPKSNLLQQFKFGCFYQPNYNRFVLVEYLSILMWFDKTINVEIFACYMYPNWLFQYLYQYNWTFLFSVDQYISQELKRESDQRWDREPCYPHQCNFVDPAEDIKMNYGRKDVSEVHSV